MLFLKFKEEDEEDTPFEKGCSNFCDDNKFLTSMIFDNVSEYIMLTNDESLVVSINRPLYHLNCGSLVVSNDCSLVVPVSFFLICDTFDGKHK